MKTFNSFQIVAAFLGWPFLIQWLSAADFKGSSAAFYMACAFYIVAFIYMVGCVRSVMDKDEFWPW